MVLGPPLLVLVIVLAIVVARSSSGGGGAAVALPPAAVPPQEFTLDLDLRAPLPGSDFDFARVERVIDGDTFEATVRGTRVTVRLYGVNAPERARRCASEAAARLRALLPRGATVLLHPGPRNGDDFGRLLRYAFRESDKTSIDALLIDEGLAEAWRADGQLRGQLAALEQRARQAGRGCLWS